MKLVIQVPAYNEEKFLGAALDDIRQHLPKSFFTEIIVVVINDCSTDKTGEVAHQKGIVHVVNLPRHSGLGVVFAEGLRYALTLGADIIVNTDADLQYRAADFNNLLAPLLAGKADMVIGNRQLSTIPSYPKFKYWTQQTGNGLISLLYGKPIKDSTSGFRAMTRECSQWLLDRMNNPYTYTIESLCLLLKAHQRICFVPITIRPTVRESRLIKNKWRYIQNYLTTAIRCFFRK